MRHLQVVTCLKNAGDVEFRRYGSHAERVGSKILIWNYSCFVSCFS